jgi:imidazolonepropionase-like amidohydrolase
MNEATTASATPGMGVLSRGLLQVLIVLIGTLHSPGYAQTSSEVPSLVIRGARIVTVSGPVIDDGMIVITNGLITDVGTDLAVPAGARIIEAKGLTVYPGLIDSLTDIGLSATPASGAAASGAGHEASRGPAGRPATSPWRNPAQELTPEDPRVEQWRNGGFTSVLTAPRGGIFPGQCAVINLTRDQPQEMLVRAPVALILTFERMMSPSEFPNSLMGVLAYIRQVFVDADQYGQAQAIHGADPHSTGEPAYDRSLAVISETLRSKSPILLPADSATRIRRVLSFSAALGIKNLVIYGGQEAYSAAADLAKTKATVLVGVKWPREEADPDPEDPGSLRLLRFREKAPSSPAALEAAGVRYAFYSDGLSSPGEVLKNVREAVDAGLPADSALRALTLTPAEIFGVANSLGSIEPGKLANLVVTDGDLLGDQTRITLTIVKGRVYEVSQLPPRNALSTSNSSTNTRKTVSPQPTPRPLRDPRPTFIANATILTITNGAIRNGSILIRDGKIAEVGRALKPPPDAQVIDATGQFVMPGIIDCHSHIAIEGAWYESSVSVASMASVADVLNPDDVNIYRSLAGGVTTANILYSSFNPIGGQTAVIKLRWGELAGGLIFQGAPPGIKFALGENPKRGSGSATASGSARYPRTRMGVIDVIREAFVEAVHYKKSWDEYNRKKSAGDQRLLPPHRDLKLEPLVEVLEGKRFVHVHSYRAYGILALLRVADEFGFKVRTLQHAIEGYKVADEIARHGVGASTFSDWWAYKFEAYDAIPYNAAMMTRRGIVVSINSDSAEEAHHLNQEAAKSMKWGGLSETEALKLITLNPAIQLGIDSRVGSIEVGKDADLSIWNAHPLSTFAVVQKVLIDGQVFFDRHEDRLLRVEVEKEKKAMRERNTGSNKHQRSAS